MGKYGRWGDFRNHDFALSKFEGPWFIQSRSLAGIFCHSPRSRFDFCRGLDPIYGTDHPAGKWSERHKIPATEMAIEQGHDDHDDRDEKKLDEKGVGDTSVTVRPVEKIASIDVAVNKRLTFNAAFQILASPVTWLPALAYLTTFGVELAIDSQMSNVLFGLYSKKIAGFDQTTAGYYTSIFGFLNLVTRPLGGYVADLLYRSFGTRGKKVWTLFCGLIMGAALIGGGFYIENHRTPTNSPSLATIMGIFSLAVIFSEFGNGANFALVPHCNVYNNGVMSGLAGSFGTLGGVIFTLIFRFQTAAGKGFWIMGIISVVINVLLLPIPVPAY